LLFLKALFDGEIEIEGLSDEDKANIDNIIDKIKQNEKIFTFYVKSITPLIVGDANTKQNSIIRATEIKASMRSWLRKFFWILDIKDSNLLEDIFGSNNNGSAFDLIIETKDKEPFYFINTSTKENIENLQKLIEEIIKSLSKKLIEIVLYSGVNTKKI